jgi:hypothetical protein
MWWLGGLSHGPHSSTARNCCVVQVDVPLVQNKGEDKPLGPFLDPKQRLLAPYIYMDLTDIAKDTEETIQR